MRSLFWGGMRRDNDSNNRGSNSLFLVIGLIAAIIAPIAAILIQMAISRRREFLADASGALITRYPEGLARALEKIASDPRVSPHASTATAHFYIENPFKTDSRKKNISWFVQLFSTHPPVEKRIKILRSM
jgi:heat shock protein HtpX